MKSHLKPPSNPLGIPEQRPNNDDRLRDAREVLQWLDPLCDDPNFQRFLAWVRKGADSNAKMALDVSIKPKERNNFAQRHNALATVATYPEGQRDAARALIANHKP